MTKKGELNHEDRNSFPGSAPKDGNPLPGFAPQAGCLLARRQLSVGRPDLSLRQSFAARTAKTVARKAPGSRTLGHHARPKLHLRALEPRHQEV